MKLLKNGYLYVTAAAMFWAGGGVASKYLFNNGVSPYQLVQLRLGFSAFFLFAGMLVFRPSLLKIAPRDIFYFIILGTAGAAAVQGSYLYAISKINVAAAILLQYLAPVFITAWSFFVLREKVRTSTFCALTGTILGCYFLVGGYNLNLLAMNKLGILSGILSAMAFAFYSYQAEYGMHRYSPFTVLFYPFFFGALAWNILWHPFEGFTRGNSPAEWGWIIYTALCGNTLPFILYFKGIQLIRAIRAGITATLEPIAAALISFLFLNESMEVLQIAGGVGVIASVIVMQLTPGNEDESYDQSVAVNEVFE